MDCDFLKNSLKNYFELLSEKKPVPGGGSAVSCLASLSSSLLNMVLNYTIGKKGYAEYETELKKIKERNDIILNECMNFIEEDSRIYLNIDRAMKEGRNFEEFLKESVNLHFKICKYMIEIVDFCEFLSEKGNKNLISDTGISNIFALSAFFGAKLNILINLKFMKDGEFVKRVKDEIEGLELKIKEKSEILNKKIVEKIWG